jgi:signal transduction histidine kinase
VRPLDFLRSIKLKLGVVIVAAVAVTVVVVTLGQRADLSPVLTGLAAAALALAVVQVLAHGMTYPLREMVAAARAMAHGDYGRRVTATSRDEVGELARAFNAMAAELAGVDRMRRDLVANVSHELRTPIGALQALLENLADGVEPPDPRTLRVALAQTERLGRLVAQLLDLSRMEYAHEATAGLTTIAVADEGPGIPAEETERVFERFHRLDGARAARDGGSGLGLAIARWIVDAHGGAIRAERREPHGCRMVVELPR